MVETETAQLRVLIANAKRDRLAQISGVVAGLGHVVITPENDGDDIAAAIARQHPDVALVGLGSSPEHALELISEIVREATCPVIAMLVAAENPGYVNEAAARGVFAYIVDGGSPAEGLQSTFSITLRRFAEYRNLQGAFDRRATIEQAKGILMARHAVDADEAFDMLREHSQHSDRRLIEVAEAVVHSHTLLPPLAPLRRSGAAHPLTPIS